MADYSPDEIIDMIMILGECNGVYVNAVARYAECFPNRRHPRNITIIDLTNRARHGHENNVRTLTILVLIHQSEH